jgi:hypothetical protein
MLVRPTGYGVMPTNTRIYKRPSSELIETNQVLELSFSLVRKKRIEAKFTQAVYAYVIIDTKQEFFYTGTSCSVGLNVG